MTKRCRSFRTISAKGQRKRSPFLGFLPKLPDANCIRERWMLF